MNPTMIMDFFDRFLGEGFTLERALERFGKIDRRSGENILWLEPRFDDIEPVELHTLKNAAGQAFLTDVFLRYKKPVRLPIGPFEERYGAGKALPPLPSPPLKFSLAFSKKGKVYEGNLLLDIAAEDPRTPLVSGVHFDRLPPEWSTRSSNKSN